MPSPHDAASLSDHVSRREWLRVGGLSAVGLSLPAPLGVLQPLGRFAKSEVLAVLTSAMLFTTAPVPAS